MCAVIALVENKLLSEELRRALMRPNILPIFYSLHSWIISVCKDRWKKKMERSYISASKTTDLYITVLDFLLCFSALVLKHAPEKHMHRNLVFPNG